MSIPLPPGPIPSGPLPAAGGPARLGVTVIVPTYRRPDQLAACLDGLARQTLAPAQVIVTVRDDDPASADAARRMLDRLPVEVAGIGVPGQVAAINRGIDGARGDVVAITDDDAVPHPDWVERIERWYRTDARIGGVGGRDHVYHDGVLEDGAARTVGRLQWFGRVVGNHHIGTGPARDVDVLKGANWSFRRSAIGGKRLNTRLRGSGAQVRNEVDFCLRLRREGWRLVYDPLVAVDHFPAVRHDIDQRGAGHFHPLAQENATYNDTLALMAHFGPLHRPVFVSWALLMGTCEFPGLAQWARLALRGDRHAAAKLRATLRGRLAGMREWRGAPA
ncbi:glycosyltransferase family 2 protein [Azospirillum picis]|uniref:GT2 family glycosyltransferase n=1 Tax=Azospirillum picis TaxID=488438 RepID=A0ABU0MHQ6_9PROT|nr:glycosyltransferase [Azospirillum picis]MBP2299373.1 GT2 family glycosyltransferase [Azospirillum picis]MDQ0532989.1 GT2 family glycosyltransferase [Azospirillum picis]